MSFVPPTVAQFQAQFTRDWPYGTGPETVTSADIQNAINEAFNQFNPALFDQTVEAGTTRSEAMTAYNFLAAHLMVLNIQNAGGLSAPSSFQGISSSGGGVVSSKRVGNVSVAYVFSDYVLKSSILSQYMRTGYGQKYLQLALPKLPGGAVAVVGGEATVIDPTAQAPVAA